jgi:hypothetical protein
MIAPLVGANKKKEPWNRGHAESLQKLASLKSWGKMFERRRADVGRLLCIAK